MNGLTLLPSRSMNLIWSESMARKRVQSGAADGRHGRSRAGCLAGYTSSYGLSQMGFDWPGCTSLVALLVGLESLLLYRPAGL